MDSSQSKSDPAAAALFQVYLRLRPPPPPPPPPANLCPTILPERFLSVESSDDDAPTHIILNPPNDNRRRAVEKFAFTKVFEESSSQLQIFQEAGIVHLIQGVLRPNGGDGRDGLLATLGVTGSGKTHTILGSRSQRGLTQLSLDVLFRSLSANILDPNSTATLHGAIAASDPSEAHLLTIQGYLDTIYGNPLAQSQASSRAPTPLNGDLMPQATPRRPPRSNLIQPTTPDVSFINAEADPNAEYAVVVSMYEVYNDRIYDLLTTASKTASTRDYRRRPLLFKPTEQSPDRKVVAGLRKVICSNAKEALTVLDAGLQERRIAQTGTNSVSSRSHGFFCVEVKKKRRGKSDNKWIGNTLTIVDLAGSERARDAKTQGATLAEAGKINESLMYLGQCLQLQSDIGSGNTKPNLVPYRQCKLTELLFSNSFPSPNSAQNLHRIPQQGVMIVTADPLGDFNATSQILRYSALAREITIPRVPSVQSTIFGKSSQYFNHRDHPDESHGPSSPTNSDNSSSASSIGPHSILSPNDSCTSMVRSEDRAVMEMAAMEIARLTEELDCLRTEIEREQQLRLETEAHLLSSQERVGEIEAEVREECWAEMEKLMKMEGDRWKGRWEEEQERNEEHWDRKVEILSRVAGQVEVRDESDEDNDDDDDEGPWKQRVNELEDENERLRRQVENLTREFGVQRSPSKKNVQQQRQRRVLTESINSSRPQRSFTTSSSSSALTTSLESLRMKNKQAEAGEVGGTRAISGKRVRKLGGKRWDLDLDLKGGENEE